MDGTVLVVSGAPASGKTTLARDVAQLLQWPLVSKDTIKEVLYDELGSPRSRRRSKRMGSASFEIMYALVADMPTAVLETHWYPAISAPRLRAMGRPLIEICCQCSKDVRLDRIGTRDRHPGHLETRLNLIPRLIRRRMTLGFEEPLHLGGPLLTVDTSSEVDSAAVADWVRGRHEELSSVGSP